MAKYQCVICSYIYDEKIEKEKWEDLGEDWVCPVCTAGKSNYKPVEGNDSVDNPLSEKKDEKLNELDYDSQYKRTGDNIEKYMDAIHQMSVTGKSIIEPMRTRLNVISWDDILIKGAQLFKLPLNMEEKVDTTTVIGRNAKHPLVIEAPIIITHMSFGALSKEVKIALAKGSAAVKTAMSSGEGGILEESINNSYKYIFEYVPNKYSVTDENLRRVDAVEIKIGQGTKPGMGGHLPAEKITDDIARIRGKDKDKDIISPARFNEINNKEDLKKLVDILRDKTDGKPIGIKLAAGHIEKDIEVAVYANPDFITIDGRGGGTGASQKFIKDSTSVPTIYALHRARKYLDSINRKDIDLIITGGLRISSDFVKAIAMGASAVAIGTAALISCVCQQYRICDTGKCPVGCATQDDKLRERVDVDAAARRVENFLKVSIEEMRDFARLTGNDNIHNMSVEDLCTANSEISNYTDIEHA